MIRMIGSDRILDPNRITTPHFNNPLPYRGHANTIGSLISASASGAIDY